MIQSGSEPTLSSILGNVVALGILLWKTVYDVWWNERLHRRAIDGKTHLAELSNARQQKANRARMSTIITFAVLAVSYIIFIVGELFNV